MLREGPRAGGTRLAGVVGVILVVVVVVVV